MAAVIKIQIESSGGAGDVAKDVDKIGDSADGAGKKFSAMGEVITGALRHIGALAIDAVVGGFQAIGGAISDGIEDAKNYAIIAAQTEAVIKSTGGAAGVSAEHVAEYAGSLSDAAGMSLFGDDQIQQSTNLLLTFSEIKGSVLDAATAISVDMAQAMGGAPKDAAIQLGKALNDPVKGITALTRVGVVFTEEQKAQIQAMQEAGDMAGAQGVILAELNKEFGGSAQAAAAATGGWSEFNGRMGEAKEALGTALLPLFNQFAGVLLSTVMPAIEGLAAQFGPFVESLGPLVAQVQGFISGLMASFAETSPLDAMSAAVQMLSVLWTTQLQPALLSVWTVLQTQVWPILSDLAAAIFPAFGAAIQILIPAIKGIWFVITNDVLPILAILAAWLKDNLPGAIQWLADFLTGTLFPGLAQIHSFIIDNVVPILAMLAEWLITNVPIAIQAATDFFNNILLPAINAVWAFIQNNVLPLFATLFVWLQTTIPAGLQTLANFWNTVLLPAINAVWAFVQNFLIPLFTALVNLHLAVLGLAVRTLTAIWQKELLPAITAIWTFIQTQLGPIFTWLNTMILTPLLQTLKNIGFFVLGALMPYMQNLAQVISGTVTSAFNGLEKIAGNVRGALKSIGEAVSGVIGWLNDLAAKLNSISIPDWLQGHSPPPMANWFGYIADAIKTVVIQFGEMAESSVFSETFLAQIKSATDVMSPMLTVVKSALDLFTDFPKVTKIGGDVIQALMENIYLLTIQFGELAEAPAFGDAFLGQSKKLADVLGPVLSVVKNALDLFIDFPKVSKIGGDVFQMLMQDMYLLLIQFGELAEGINTAFLAQIDPVVTALQKILTMVDTALPVLDKLNTYTAAKGLSAFIADVGALTSGFAVQIAGGGGGNTSNVSSSHSFTYAPQYSGGQALEGPMDLALASSLAMV